MTVGRIALWLGALARRLWVRVSLFGLAGVLTALVAAAAAPFVPAALADQIDEGAVENLLEIMASSMLLVTTFSLGSLVTAYTAAARLATPRATRVLIDDPLSQSVLATFLGAFAFAMVGIVAISLGYYGHDGRVVLLGATIVVIIAVIVMLFGWVDYLSQLVRLGHTISMVEGRAGQALADRLARPLLGGVPRAEEDAGFHPVRQDRTGYLVDIDMAALQNLAEVAEGTIAVESLPGTLLDPVAPVARTSWVPDDDGAAAIARAFVVDAERNFDADPRFGLIVLSEVGSRALSPGVNDPGTAIGIVGRLQRLITDWTAGGEAEPVRCGRVRVPALAVEDLMDDAFAPLGRDAAGVLEVGVRLQKCFAALAALGDPALARAARHQSERALAQARAALPLEEDGDRLAALADEVGRAPPG